MKKQAYYDQISHTLSQKMLEEKEVNYKISHLRYQEELIKLEVNLKVDKLNKLQLSLDKLSFANTAYRGKPTTSSCFSSAHELDKQKLQFLMRHGSKNMGNEKKLLGEIALAFVFIDGVRSHLDLGSGNADDGARRRNCRESG